MVAVGEGGVVVGEGVSVTSGFGVVGSVFVEFVVMSASSGYP